MKRSTWGLSREWALAWDTMVHTCTLHTQTHEHNAMHTLQKERCVQLL